MSGYQQYHPLFAAASSQQANGSTQTVPSSGGGGGEDFDINEIFADYFISEFDDPINAYTSSMANFTSSVKRPDPSGVSTSIQLPQQQQPPPQQQQQQPVAVGITSLPTGGIKTAFHFPGGGPLMKKPKTELSTTNNLAVAQQANNGMQNISQLLQQDPQLLQQQQQQQQPPPPQQMVLSRATPGSLGLPVGVGIRMGGLGGIAAEQALGGGAAGMPKTAQSMNIWDQGYPGMSEQALAERRLRNREHAKRSRVRKKFMLESLQEQVHQLQKENEELRLIVQSNIPEKAQEIIAECCTSNPLFDNVDETYNGGAGGGGMVDPMTGERTPTPLVQSDYSLVSSLSVSQQNFILSDPRLPDNPIVFASPGFYEMTGYTAKEVMGRNCRFLQGPGTDSRAVEVIRKAVHMGSDSTVCFLNYKADGTPFWNQLFIAALRDSDNNIVNFVGVVCEVEPEAGGNALEDRVNAVLPLQSKDDEDED